jgi:hypothetical protein
MSYTVKAGYAVCTRAGQGAYLLGTLVDVVVPTSAADATNDRYDVLYIFQPDPELADTGVARIDVAVGTPSASPATPAVPTGSLVLGRKLVVHGSSNTSTGTAIDQLPSLTGLNVTWDALGGKPASFPPSAHSASLVTSGTLPSAVSVAGNLSSGLVQGKKITISQTAPTSPAVGDLWISW